MKISYLFSRNKKIGSRLISWASGLLVKDLEKVPSHMAVLCEFKYLSLVFESTIESGVRIVPYKAWLKINEECYKISEKRQIDPKEIYDMTNKLWGSKYDWKGIAFFALCFIQYIFFKTPFPKQNKWQDKNKYFCNELAGILAEYENYSMVTPAKMCSDFLKMEKQNG